MDWLRKKAEYYVIYSEALIKMEIVVLLLLFVFSALCFVRWMQESLGPHFVNECFNVTVSKCYYCVEGDI